MNKLKFGFLGEYFYYQNFKIRETDALDNLLKQTYKENYANYEYALCLVEKNTNAVIDISFLHSKDNDFEQTNHFNFYLNQLPGLDLDNVALMFALISTPNNKLIDGVFSIQNNYPSEFAKAYLKRTFGNVIYTYQFMELLSFCLPAEENNYKDLNDYRKLYNIKQTAFLKKLENLYLPDGYSLFTLMKSFTPLRKELDDFGYLIKPNHKLAHLFIQQASKYLPV